MYVLSIDTTSMTIGAAVLELYSFVFEFDENDTKNNNKKKKKKKNNNNQLPLLELLVAAKNGRKYSGHERKTSRRPN